MSRFIPLVPMIVIAVLLVAAGFEIYWRQRLPLRGGGEIIGKKAQVLGLILLLFGMSWLVVPLLYFGGYITAIDLAPIWGGTLIAEVVAVLLIRIFYNPQE